MNRDRRSPPGFTVLEALVAIAVLGLVAVAVVRLLGETAQAARRGEEAWRRAALADALWQLVREDAADPRTVEAMMPEGFTWDVARSPATGRIGSGTDGAPLAGLERVTVTVTDPDGGRFVLRSLVYRP
ncbi:MAG TPA: prepilin-type N-terminal cleavage/methylation domain-containing protein [Rhodospirillales bacterium]|nr:prepilin-type N-terminal cleavage/methylation domain-containing protein [Rhodospirillales bacterium]